MVKTNKKELGLLRKNMDDYLCSGFGIPLGLLEEWKELTGEDYKPSNLALWLYKIITGKKYE